MHKILRGYAPLGAMATLTIWCCWSQLGDTMPLIAADNDEQLPRLERETLRPQLSNATTRDPFRQAVPEADLEEVVEAPVTPQLPVEPPFDPRVVLPSLNLGATVMGTHRVSVINGRVYGEGEKIQVDSFPEVQCRLKQVRAKSVMVEINGDIIEIHYGLSTRPAPVHKPIEKVVKQLPSLAEIGEMFNSALAEDAPRLEGVQLDEAGAEATPIPADQPVAPNNNQDHKTP